MMVRRDDRSAYDRMMAEIQVEDDRAADAKVIPPLKQLHPKQSKGRTCQEEEKKKGDNDYEEEEDHTADAKGQSATVTQRHHPFPPKQPSTSSLGVQAASRSQQPHSSSADSDEEEDTGKAAVVKHAALDAFNQNNFPAKPPAANIEMDALRAFLTRAPKAGSHSIRCYVERDRHGLKMLHPVFRLYLEDTKQFLLCAQKRSSNKTSNYLLTLEKNPTDRRSPFIVGKLRGNWSGSEYILYDDGLNPSKTALAANVRSILGVIEFGYDEMGPGQIHTRVPRVQENGLLSAWKDTGYMEKDDLKARSKLREEMDKNCTFLRNKRPQYDERTGGHVLDFQGRVTMPSIKNFQMQSDTHGTETTLQFGRVSCQPPGPQTQCKCHKNIFTMDFKHPLSPLQAFAICLSTLDSKLADLKFYDNVTKFVKRK